MMGGTFRDVGSIYGLVPIAIIRAMHQGRYSAHGSEDMAAHIMVCIL